MRVLPPSSTKSPPPFLDTAAPMMLSSVGSAGWEERGRITTEDAKKIDPDADASPADVLGVQSQLLLLELEKFFLPL